MKVYKPFKTNGMQEVVGSTPILSTSSAVASAKEDIYLALRASKGAFFVLKPM